MCIAATVENPKILTGRYPVITSNKPFPDESNREAIEQMLLHAFEFAVRSGFLTPDGTLLAVDQVQVEDLPIAGFGVPVVTMNVKEQS